MSLKKLCYLVTSPGTFQQEHGNGLSSTDCQSVTGPRLPAILKPKKDWSSELVAKENPSDSQSAAMSGVAPEKVLQENGTYGVILTTTVPSLVQEEQAPTTHTNTVKLSKPIGPPNQVIPWWYWWRT